MIGEQVTVTYNAVAYTLERINQDNYSSEYLKRDAVHELRLRIRHQNEKASPGQKPFERHNVELTRTVFDAVNGDKVYQAYQVIRLQKGTDPDAAELVNKALCALTTDAFVDKIVGWQS